MMRVALLFTGWLLFVVSLFLPAIRSSDFLFSGTFKGYLCLAFSLPAIGAFVKGEPKGVYLSLVGLSNLLMLASPALCWWGGRWDARQRPAFLMAAMIVCLSRVVLNEAGSEFLIGYYVWCASFLFVAAAANMR